MKIIGPGDPIPEPVAMSHGEYQEDHQWLPFEFKGYFEDFLDTEFVRFLGVRYLKECPDGRLLGSSGRKCYTLTEPIELQKGTKTYILKASKKRPIQVATQIQIMGGRANPLPNDVEFVKQVRASIDLEAPRTW